MGPSSTANETNSFDLFLVLLLVYADTFEIEGIISSRHGEGRAARILEAIDMYEKDDLKLASYSLKYPSPDSLRMMDHVYQNTIPP